MNIMLYSVVSMIKGLF